MGLEYPKEKERDGAGVAESEALEHPMTEARKDPSIRAIDSAFLATMLAVGAFAGGALTGMKSEEAKKEGAALAFKTDNYKERADVVAKHLQEVQDRFDISLEGAVKLSLLSQQQFWMDSRMLNSLDPNRQYSAVEIRQIFNDALDKEAAEIKLAFKNREE